MNIIHLNLNLKFDETFKTVICSLNTLPVNARVFVFVFSLRKQQLNVFLLTPTKWQELNRVIRCLELELAGGFQL